MIKISRQEKHMYWAQGTVRGDMTTNQKARELSLAG